MHDIRRDMQLYLLQSDRTRNLFAKVVFRSIQTSELSARVFGSV